MRAEVILHVARALRRVRIELALELEEDLPVALAHDVGEHVETAAVRHAHHDLGDAGDGSLVEQELEHRDERLRAFEGEALLAEVLRVQEALERLGRVQRQQDLLLVVVRQLARIALHLILDPRLLVVFLDVHVLDADRARA